MTGNRGPAADVRCRRVPCVAHTRGVRFGLHFWALPKDSWRERVRHYEELGFSSITFTDHQVVSQWEPIAALAAVAPITTSVAIGTLVLDMGLRNPVLTAKAAATLELLSGGRLELGLGRGIRRPQFRGHGPAVCQRRPEDRTTRGGARTHAPVVDGAVHVLPRELLRRHRCADGGGRAGVSRRS